MCPYHSKLAPHNLLSWVELIGLSQTSSSYAKRLMNDAFVYLAYLDRNINGNAPSSGIFMAV